VERYVPRSGDAFAWVHRLPIVPKELLPPGPGETSLITVERYEHLQNDVDNRSGGASATLRLRSRLLMCSFRPTFETEPLRIHLPPVDTGFYGSSLRRLVYHGGITCPPNGGMALCFVY